ncbi:LamG domain-containing protein, partial [Patescibacteria group bacterium]|nr:LamG domain-containing protein [Patescibacteria group bacterium]
MFFQKNKNLFIIISAVFSVVVLFLGIKYVLAANNGNSFGYAWGEGAGWIRFDGTDYASGSYGVTVPSTDGAFVTGYAWGEDAGWIHFSGSCDEAGGCPQESGNSYGVVASRATCSAGTVCLSGYAWGEGAGWIRFAATSSTYANDAADTYGVYIDNNGDFQGYAWGEDAGWIHFSGSCDEAGGCPSGGDTYGVSGATSTGSFSMGLWIKPTVSVASKALAIKNNEIRLATDVDGKPICQIHNGTSWQTAATSSMALVLSQWSYVACVYDRSNIKIYVDGVLQATQSTSDVDIQNTYNNLKLGEDDSGDYSDFQGYIDDFKVYNYARSASQVKSDYNAQADPTPKGSAVKSSVTVGQARDSGEGLVAYWKMDETYWNGTSGEVIDSSGNANHGTSASGANTTSTAKFGMAGTFDGTDDYITVSDTSPVQNIFDSGGTFEAWIYPASDGGGSVGRVIDKTDGTGTEGWMVYVTDDNGSNAKLGFQQMFASYSAWETTSRVLTLGVWNHIVVVYNNSSLTNNPIVYINGSSIALTKSGSPSGSRGSDAGNNFYLGNRSDGARAFDGQIDDVKIYKVARTAEQIRRDYETGPPPVAHWKMDENNGQYANDTSGNANNGTLGAADTADSADPTWATGKYGSALKFDGSNDYVNADTAVNDLSNTKIGTWSAWVKPTDATPPVSSNLITFGDTDANEYINLYIRINGSIAAESRDAGTVQFTLYTDSVGLSDNTWGHLTLVQDGASPVLYINGVRVAQTFTVSTDTTSWFYELTGVDNGRIGDFNFNSGGERYYFNGAIDDVRIYNYARTQKQIMEDMNAGHPAVGSPVGSYAAYWNFDEGAGDTAYDKSVNKNNGDLAGTCPGDSTCPTWTTNGKFGKALSFDGGDYTSMGDVLDIGVGDMTISAWVKPATISPASDMYFIAKSNTGATDGRYALGVSTSGKLIGIFDPGASSVLFNSNKSLTTGWNHVVGVYDRDGNLSLYINGIYDSGQSIAVGNGNNYNIANALVVGAYTSDLVLPYTGLIDEVKIYPFTLSPAEIKQEYNKGVALKLGSSGGGSSTATSSGSSLSEYCVPGDTSQCDAPVAHWKMDTKTGQYAYDTSGNANTGTLGSGATADASDPTWKSASQCHTGACLSFDGTDDYVSQTISGFRSSDSAGTVSAWIKTNNSGTINILTSADEATAVYYLIFKLTSGKLGVQQLNNDTQDLVQGTTSIADNLWHYVAVVSNGSTYSLYVDGKAESLTVDSGSNSGDWFADTLNRDNLMIGLLKRTTSTGFFNGSVDDVRIYNYARTAAQIAWDYNRGKPVAHWKMDDGQNTATTCDGTTATVKDAMTNTAAGITGNPGTLDLNGSPATSSAWSEGKYSCGLTLDGTDDYVEMQTTPTIPANQDVTVSIWAKRPSTAGSDQSIISKDWSTDRGINLRLDDDNTVFVRVGDIIANPVVNSSWTANVWQHHV